MDGLIKRFYKEDLYKILSLNGLNIFVRLLIGFLSNKALAFFIGVSGIGIIGLVKNFISFLETILLLGTRNGIVKNLASAKDKNTNTLFIVSLFWLFVSLSIGIALGIYVFSDFVNQYFFANQLKNRSHFLICSLSIPFFSLSLFFNAVLNGNFQYKKVAFIAIISNVATLLISVLLMWKWSVFGAIAAVFITSGITFFISGLFFFKIYPLQLFLSPFQFAKREVLSLVNYSAMSLISAIMSVAFGYYLRITIINQYSLEHSGYYESIVTISSFYMIFINTFMTFYYLPELSKCTEQSEITAITKSYYKNIIPLFIFGLLIILFGGQYLIPFFFNDSFKPIVPFLKYQLLLDLIKAFYLILGIRFFAFGDTKGFLIAEIFSFSIHFLFLILGLHYLGFNAVWYSQIVSACIYFIFLILYFKKVSFF